MSCGGVPRSAPAGEIGLSRPKRRRACFGQSDRRGDLTSLSVR